MAIIEQQDWEYCEEIEPGVYETIEIQMPYDIAMASAQMWANRTRHNCYVSTTIAIIDTETNSVEDRLMLSERGLPDVEPIKVQPQFVDVAGII